MNFIDAFLHFCAVFGSVDRFKLATHLKYLRICGIMKKRRRYRLQTRRRRVQNEKIDISFITNFNHNINGFLVYYNF
jgi:hypothetical protein